MTITSYTSTHISNALEPRNETYIPNFPFLDGTLTFLSRINFTTVNGIERINTVFDPLDTVEGKSPLDSNVAYPDGLMVNQT